MTMPQPPRAPGRVRGVARGLGLVAQDWLLDELAFGVVLFGLIDLAVAVGGPGPVGRAVAAVVGGLAVVTPLVGYRRRWSVSTKWTVMPPLGATALATFLLLVHS